MSSLPAALEAVIFDLDGTLLDTAPEFIQVVQQLRREHGLAPLPEAAIKATVSDGARAMVALALDLDPEDEIFELKRLRFLQIYQQDLGSATLPYPGIVELLQELSQAGVAWGISTNKPSYLAVPLMARVDLKPPAGSIVCPDHVTQPKPHPEPLLLNCEQLSCRPPHSVYVGDHRRDIEAGNAAGMFTIAAAYGYVHDAGEPETWGANAIANTAQELPGLIRAAFA